MAFASFKCLSVSCAVLGVIQSTIWIIVTIILMIAQSCLISLNVKDTSDLDRLTGFEKYKVFFLLRYSYDNKCVNNDNLIEYFDKFKPKTLTYDAVWTWIVIYFVINVVWLFVSWLLLVVSCRNTKKLFQITVILWAAGTLAIHVIDVVLTSILINDFVDIQNGPDLKPDYKTPLFTVSIIMIAIVTKGVFLWLINVLMMILLVNQTLGHVHTASNNHLAEDAQSTSSNSTFTVRRNEIIEQWNNPMMRTHAHSNPSFNHETNVERRTKEAPKFGWTMKGDVHHPGQWVPRNGPTIPPVDYALNLPRVNPKPPFPWVERASLAPDGERRTYF